MPGYEFVEESCLAPRRYQPSSRMLGSTYSKTFKQRFCIVNITAEGYDSGCLRSNFACLPALLFSLQVGAEFELLKEAET